MESQRVRTLTGIALSISLGLILSVSVSAQQTNQSGGGQALEISPPVLTLNGNPGETIKAQISIRDVSNNPLIVRGEANDFVARGEDGTPKLLLEPGETSPYSIKNWVAPLPQLTLKPKQIEQLTVNLAIPANAAPGGYYGVIRFSGTPPELEGTGVSLSASLGTLVLLRVNGDAKQQLSIEEFFVSQSGYRNTFFESTPVQFVQRIKNSGNVHEQPSGQVKVTDMFGNVVATVNVNMPIRNILPSSIRRFEQPLDSSVIGNKILFGRYDADMALTYGTNQKLSAKTSFWIIPWRWIILAVVVLIVGFVLIRLAIRRYNESVIRRSRRSRRR